MDEMVYWIWLSLAVTPGSTTFSTIYRKYKDPYDIYLLEQEDFRDILGSKCTDTEALLDKDLSRAEDIYRFCTTKGIGLLNYADDNYPNSLREIQNPPVLLYYRGKLPSFNDECFVSVVGTRRLTDYGRKNAYSISFDLARAGAIIVSGMAIGIDGVAMAGAIAAGGTTVAVLGCGIDICYPEVHKTLAREIVKRGCVMTEYPPKTPPIGRHFPVRNRIISALGVATVVIEGKIGSGAVLTARHAKKQGKTIYALPGNVDNSTSEVCNLLIQNGAKLVTQAENIIDDFEFVCLGKLNRFNLAERVDMKMKETLLALEVSCVAPSDNIFSPFPDRKKNGEKKYTSTKTVKIDTKDAQNSETLSADSKAAEHQDAAVASFDKRMLEIYRKIPLDGDCSIESLCSSDYPLREVMRIIMKLEMNKFIIKLPAERVRRNLI